jgi:hypothetical protein
MSKRKYKIVPSRSIFSDVDDTLIKWPQPGTSFKDHPDAIELNMLGGGTMWVIPMLENINALKKFYETGYEVVVWSMSSKQWADVVVDKLGLREWVDYCVSKPDFYLDDYEVTHFMFPEKRIFYPHKPE